MEKLYYRIPYIRQFEAKVVSCEKGKKGFEVILDRTAVIVVIAFLSIILMNLGALKAGGKKYGD